MVNFDYDIQKHEADIRVLLALLDDDGLKFATVNPAKFVGFHTLGEHTQNLVDEALNLLLSEKQKSVEILRGFDGSQVRRVL